MKFVSRPALCGAVAVACLLPNARPGASQEAPELPIRTAALAHPLAECPAWDRGALEGSTPEELAEARSLSSAAREAALLGDPASVRDLLQRASGLDPASRDLAYDLARAHEELGETEQAIRGYCRALALMDAGDDLEDVRGRLARLQEPLGPAISQEALQRFNSGVQLMQEGALAAATQMFSSALTSDVGIADAYYNRGLAYGALRQPAAALADFRTYLERRPQASDRDDVLSAISFLEEPPGSFSASTALVLGLTLPGTGHFYTGRPLGGAFFLTLTAGAAAAGLLYEKVEIRCLGVPRDGVCPEEDVISREETRPFLVPALGVVGAGAVISAISAYRGANARNDAAGRLRIEGSGDGVALLGGIRLLPPGIAAFGDGIVLEALRLRF